MTTELQNDVKIFEKILSIAVESEVKKEIHKTITPIVETLVKKVAEEATKKWSYAVKKEFIAEDMSTRIQINFVENIVKTVFKENDISIEVNKER
jgi:hypothetical protein